MLLFDAVCGRSLLFVVVRCCSLFVVVCCHVLFVWCFVMLVAVVCVGVCLLFGVALVLFVVVCCSWLFVVVCRYVSLCVVGG